MTTEQKVELVASAQDTYGLTLALAAVDLPKSTWYYNQRQRISYTAKYARLRPVLEQIALEHPEYGVPRTVVELREQYGLRVNHKVLRRLHRLWDLALLRTTRSPNPHPIRQVIKMAGDRVNLVAKLEKIEPFQVCYTDFTEILYDNGQRKAYFMPIIGHQCKVAYGWALSQSPNRDAARKAWTRAKVTLQTHGIEWHDMIMHHDQDSVYTSYDWTGLLLRQDQVRLSYALNGAKDNPFIESFFGRFKTEGHSRFLVANNLEELERIVTERVDYYNHSRRHSSLDYQTPSATLRQMRLNCQGADVLSVDSVDNLGQVTHPDHRTATTANPGRHQLA